MDQQAPPEPLIPRPEPGPTDLARKALAARAALAITLRCLAIVTAVFVALPVVLAIASEDFSAAWRS